MVIPIKSRSSKIAKNHDSQSNDRRSAIPWSPVRYEIPNDSFCRAKHSLKLFQIGGLDMAGRLDEGQGDHGRLTLNGTKAVEERLSSLQLDGSKEIIYYQVTVSGLETYEVNEDGLREMFALFGPVQSVRREDDKFKIRYDHCGSREMALEAINCWRGVVLEKNPMNLTLQKICSKKKTYEKSEISSCYAVSTAGQDELLQKIQVEERNGEQSRRWRKAPKPSSRPKSKTTKEQLDRELEDYWNTQKKI